jgi:hypothetical protein
MMGSMSRDIYADIVAIVSPVVAPPAFPDDDVEDEQRREAAVWAQEERNVADAEMMRLVDEADNVDPLLAALGNARAAKAKVEQRIRQLIAYGREFVQPRPYTLDALATAAGLSVSGVRTAYGHTDVEAVAAATGAKPREWRAADPADSMTPEDVLADLQHGHPHPDAVAQLWQLLVRGDWTPRAPESRSPGSKPTRRYLRWERTWPNGTSQSIYQERTWLATGNNITVDDPRRLYASYATGDLTEATEQLAALVHRIDQLDARRP